VKKFFHRSSVKTTLDFPLDIDYNIYTDYFQEINMKIYILLIISLPFEEYNL